MRDWLGGDPPDNSALNGSRGRVTLGTEEIVEVFQLTPQERISERLIEQVVDFPVPQIPIHRILKPETPMDFQFFLF